jgi:hypothetical protein
VLIAAKLSARTRAALPQLDLALLAAEQPREIVAVAHDDDERNEEHDESWARLVQQQPGIERRTCRGGERRERGVAEDDGDDDPGRDRGERCRPGISEKRTTRGGDALAALEAQPDRKDMPERGGDGGRGRRIGAKALRDQHRQESF